MTSFPKFGSTSEEDIMIMGGENAAGLLSTNEVYTTSGKDPEKIKQFSIASGRVLDNEQEF